MSGLSLRRLLAISGAFAALAAIVVLIAPFIGGHRLDLGEALGSWSDVMRSADARIFWLARLPRVLLAALVGGALAVAGCAFQALLRNPLADPYTLGASSGAALGAVIGIKLGLAIKVFGLSTVPLFGLAGAGISVSIVYLLARGRNGLPASVLLLAGVTVSFLFSALILFVHYIADFTETYSMVRWLMGGLDVVGIWVPLRISLPVLGGVAILIGLGPSLNQLAVDPQLAASRGVDIERTQRLAYFAASLVVGLCVSVSGPIGFVGLIVPHTVRMIVGQDNRLVLPCSLFLGAALLVACDTAARSIIPSTEMPVGVLTAMIGGPFFLGLLLRAKKRGQW
ncbi:MAG: iron ABC transporter permease [Candidatus Alcyoniella australis]|nr:iron ABC transporter permease [Candidatus Alcyoniella australis]